MKKSIMLVLVLALVAGAAFAEAPEWLSFGGWGRGSFVPIKIISPKAGDSIAHTGVGVSWMDRPSIGFWAHGDSDHIGFQFELNADGRTSPTFADNANLWAKPFGNNMLTIKMGQFKVDDLRGKIGDFDGFQAVTWNTGVGHGDEDSIFHRFESNDLNGVAIYSRPVEPLFIGLRLDKIAGGETGESDNLKDAWKRVQVGIGYDIDGIGLARAQYYGGSGYKGGYDYDPARIEAAFALSMIPDLTLDLGGKFFIPVDNDSGIITWSEGVVVSLGANYTAGALGVKGRIDTKFGGSTAYNDKKRKGEPFKLNAHLSPTYDLGLIIVGLDTGLEFSSAGKYSLNGGDLIEDPSRPSAFNFGIGLFGKKAYSNGFVQVGLGLMLPDNESVIFNVPVIVCYSF